MQLNGGTLDGAIISVTSDVAHEDEEAGDESTPIDQTDKPRAGSKFHFLALPAHEIFIAFTKQLLLSTLPRGTRSLITFSTVQLRWTVSHACITSCYAHFKTISTDKHGISKRFLNYFHSLDKATGTRAIGPDQTISGKVQETLSQATAQVKSVDEQKGYTKVAHEVCILYLRHDMTLPLSITMWKQYYSKAIASPFGGQVLSFYTSTSKQILDIHAEARRIADQRKAAASAPALAPGVETKA